MKNKCWLPVLFVLLSAACRQPKELIYQSVENFSMKQASNNKALLAMDIRLYNPNSYSMKLKSADVDVFLNGRQAGKMNAGNQCILPAKDTFSIPVTLEVELKNILPNVLQLLMNSDVDIKLDGKIRAGRNGVYLTIPVNYEGKQDILSGIR